jgi:hypothetical protein
VWRPSVLTLAASSALALSACSSITPISVTTTPKPQVTAGRITARPPAGPTQRYDGTAWTTVYTGTLRAGPCRGSYKGALESPALTLELHCDDGRYGIGRATRNGSQLVGGTVQLADGGTAVIQATGPEPSYRLMPDPAPWDFSWHSRQAAAAKPAP